MTTDKPTPECREKFETAYRGYGLDFDIDKDAWDRDIYKHSHIQALYEGFCKGMEQARPSELRQAGVSSELFDQQKAAGHDFTVNDEGMAFCKQCGDFMTFPAKPCLQPAAQKTEGEPCAWLLMEGGMYRKATWTSDKEEADLWIEDGLKVKPVYAALGNRASGERE